VGFGKKSSSIFLPKGNALENPLQIPLELSPHFLFILNSSPSDFDRKKLGLVFSNDIGLEAFEIKIMLETVFHLKSY
jgi:hypothetical protein